MIEIQTDLQKLQIKQKEQSDLKSHLRSLHPRCKAAKVVRKHMMLNRCGRDGLRALNKRITKDQSPIARELKAIGINLERWSPPTHYPEDRNTI